MQTANIDGVVYFISESKIADAGGSISEAAKAMKSKIEAQKAEKNKVAEVQPKKKTTKKDSELIEE